MQHLADLDLHFARHDDPDVVTGIAAFGLYVTAVSSVRGFALTLGVSVVLDLFVVYFFKRPTGG